MWSQVMESPRSPIDYKQILPFSTFELTLKFAHCDCLCNKLIASNWNYSQRSQYDELTWWRKRKDKATNNRINKWSLMGEKCELSHQVQFIKIIIVIHRKRNKIRVIENNKRISSATSIYQKYSKPSTITQRINLPTDFRNKPTKTNWRKNHDLCRK